LQAVEIPWELTEGLRARLATMPPAQLAAVVQVLTLLGSASLGILLAQPGITVEEAVVMTGAMPGRRGDGDGHEAVLADVRRMVRCLWRYARLNAWRLGHAAGEHRTAGYGTDGCAALDRAA
jgi:hypothetical protein